MRIRRDKGFLISFIINIVFNLEGAIPAIVLFVLHFTIDISIMWSLASLLVWLFIIWFRTMLLSWVNRQNSGPRVKTENKNPYSKTSYKPYNENETS